MTRKRYRRRTPPGSAPGTLVADPEAARSSISAIGYDGTQFFERTDLTVEEVRALKGGAGLLWVSVTGLADVGMVEDLGAVFGLHGLALEDVVNTHQRPKVEEYDDHVFIVVHTAVEASRVLTDQMSIFVGPGFVLTFQGQDLKCLEPVRERLRKGRGRIRQYGADFLAYSLIDAAIDNYFPLVESLGERLEKLEDAVTIRPDPGQLSEVHRLRRELLDLRRTIWPHRDLVNALIRGDIPLFEDQTRIYLRDCYDHLVQLIDLVETDREIASDLGDFYHSSMSTRLNDIMKVLTLIATIFMPLGFIAGLYGMNFDRSVSPWNMPELGWVFGYPFALGLMAICAGCMLAYFFRKRWIGPPARWRRKRKGDPDG
ncbi:MAG: magnesium/cobalt transporter CorA [Nisaea sp.]|uniref:magnesium/cobalt transporter CorA n=1 Tax=Nisaea sp. TaxID=2024842 RepID=UPI001B02718F|nr:magnesium/cobalt transporter CorA [Nisaea sp.]MBO6560808.1 magnesium/cobalt transporter CorA [Nisaea sp.]